MAQLTITLGQGFSENVHSETTTITKENVLCRVSQHGVYFTKRPGVKHLVNIPNEVIKEVIAFRHVLYIVTEDKVYKYIKNINALTLMVSKPHSNNTVYYTKDQFNIVFVDGNDLYVINHDNATVTAITTPIKPTKITYSSGFHVITGDDTGKIYTHEKPFQPAGTWAALDFATAEYAPDDIISLAVSHGTLFILGEYTMEPWSYTGNIDFPFSPVRDYYGEVGCAAPKSVATVDNTLIWLGRTETGGYSFMRMDGVSPKNISDDLLNAKITSFTHNAIAKAEASVWTISGKSLYVVTFNDAGYTFVYDPSVPAEYAWSKYSLNENHSAAQRPLPYTSSAFVQGSLVVSYASSIYEVNTNYHEDYNGRPIIASLVSPYIGDGVNSVVHSKLDLITSTGEGLHNDVPKNVTPSVSLYYSDDGGQTWRARSPESMGKMGEYKKPVRWFGLGASRGRIYKFVVDSETKYTIHKAYLTYLSERVKAGSLG